MASDENMTIHSSVMDDDNDDDIGDGYDHGGHNPHPHNLSRLSVCTSSTMCGLDDIDDDVDNAMRMYMSNLSIDNLDGDGDADEEFSDGKELPESGLFSDSENDLASCYSLPATPPRRRNRGWGGESVADWGQGLCKWRRSSRRLKRNMWGFERANNWENFDKNKKKEEDHVMGLNYSHSFSGESDQSGGTGLMVITRPKGGRRSLCMDLEEVKACRDLGFELEHERMLEMPTRLSVSNSTLDTSSGGNSPIANWRISSPGDDPRDVKARLKVWAQAVALASKAKYSS
ncbi:Protein of unknown function (DUF1685) [Quillaja saponaria]|uniref:Fold protein n=1 Tax=Quillaja saponaria TaxID=32244 RepID=A0AAD7QAH2_QUISA|nr:Protein of unknown function (DUF1685) [Quillaja saponaria]